MIGSFNNQKFFVIALKFFESIFAKVTAVSLFTMDNQYGTSDFITI